MLVSVRLGHTARRKGVGVNPQETVFTRTTGRMYLSPMGPSCWVRRARSVLPDSASITARGKCARAQERHSPASDKRRLPGPLDSSTLVFLPIEGRESSRSGRLAAITTTGEWQQGKDTQPHALDLQSRSSLGVARQEPDHPCAPARKAAEGSDRVEHRATPIIAWCAQVARQDRRALGHSHRPYV
jgi:hypothetical protein